MLFEFPFNMMPIDWPMLIFVELLFTVYILFNFIIVSLEENKTNVYAAFDWYNYPFRSIGVIILCYILLALVFTFFWAISQKWKLPRY
jgi:hypothetical protein